MLHLAKMNPRGVKAEIGEVLNNSDALAGISLNSFRIAGLSCFASIASAVSDLKEQGKLTPATKGGLAVTAGAATVGVVAAVRYIDTQIF